MPRVAREKSDTGIYHIMIRGVNRQEIFHDDEDRLRFLGTLNKIKVASQMQVYGWCLMNNHVHLLLEEGNEDISASMKRLGVSYVWYYHNKYKTSGHLFQGRFKSEKVETDQYILTVLRYIHQNPLKAKLVKRPNYWKWSSCAEYYGKKPYFEDLLSKDLVLNIISEDRAMARQKFKEFNEQDNNDSCLEDHIDEKGRLSDEEARLEILRSIKDVEITQVKTLPKKERDTIIRKIKKLENVSQRQAARILGISANLIFKA